MDRFTLKSSPELNEVYASAPATEYELRRLDMAENAYQAWQKGQAGGDTRGLADFQQDEIDRVLDSNIASRARNDEGRARLALADQAATALDEDDPDSLDAHGFHFRARDLRRQRAAADHAARVKRVDAEVKSQDRLHATLRDQFGSDAADRYMAGGSVT